MEFPSTNPDAMPLIVGKKMMTKLSMGNNDAVGGQNMSSFALKQMTKMGWSAGKGLGKTEQGITTYVRVKQRKENEGIGTENTAIEERKDQWWYNVYDQSAKKGQDKKDKKKKKKDKKTKKDKQTKFSIPTDAELFKATGGKLFGRRSYGSCVGKLKRDQIAEDQSQIAQSTGDGVPGSGVKKLKTK